jgi:two-component system, LuxR family, sensor kinase FixL
MQNTDSLHENTNPDSVQQLRGEIVRLNRNQARLVQIMDSLPGLVGYVDLQLIIVYANKLIESWYQRPRSDLIGMQLRTLFTDEHYGIVEELLKRVLNGEEINEERKIQYPDGHARIVHLNYIPDQIDDTIQGYFFLVRDVTKRRKAENALQVANLELDRRVIKATTELEFRNQQLQKENQARQKSEERYRIVSELMSDLIYVYQVDPDNRMQTIWYTGRLSKEFTPQIQDRHYRLWRPIIHPDDNGLLDERLERLLSNKTSIDEFRVIDSQGSTRWIRVFGRPIYCSKEQRVVQIMVAAQDITETKNAEAAVDQQRSRLTAALESMSDGFLLFDQSGSLVEFNDKILQLFPKVADKMTKGTKFEALVEASVKAGEIKAAKSNPQAWVTDRLTDYPSESGAREVELTDGRWVLATDRPTRDGGVVSIRTDITSRKRAEEQRRHQEAELAQVLRRASMGEMASALAHELSQPLAVIVNYSNGLLRRLERETLNRNDIQKALDSIRNAGQRAKDIVKHVGDFVRRGQPVVKNESLESMVNEVSDLLHGALIRNHIRYKVLLPTEKLCVLVNRIEITQVLFNLLRNAIDAVVQSATLDATIILQAYSEQGIGVTVSVSDNGSGVADNLTNCLFEPYITSKDSGLGMGLSISRTIVEGHGGRLWLDQNSVKGSCFKFFLPVLNNE